MALTDYTAQRFLNALFQIGSNNFGGLGTPPDLHLAASTTTPDDDGTGFTEPAGGSYARVDLQLDVAGELFGTGAALVGDVNVMENDEVIQFPTATASWGTITHIGLFDQSSGGNLIYFAQISGSSVAIDTNDTLFFQTGELEFTLT